MRKFALVILTGLMKVLVRQAIAIAMLTSIAVTANAQAINRLANAYDHYYIQPALNKLSQVPTRCLGCKTQTESEKLENNLCSSFYQKVTNDGVIKIHFSLGYFDDSEGKEYIYGDDNFGFNASTEEVWFQLLQKSLTRKCSGNLKACEFKELSPGHFVKTVKDPAGRKVSVELTTEFPSVTPYYLVNVGERAGEQQIRSEASRQAFIRAIQTDDAVFYLGHSRNGGGPDFFPPRLKADGHPNYSGYYQAKTPGLNDLLSAIQARGEAPPLLGMLSCLSEGWFGKKLVKVSPNTAYLFTQSDKLIGLDEHFMAGFAAIDGMLRFQCGEGMKEQVFSVRNGTDVYELVRNLMTTKSPVDVTAKPVIHGD